MRAAGALHIWHLFVASLPLLCSALTIRNIESWETDRPTPGTVLFFEIGEVEPTDPDVVSVYIRDTARRNNTLIFDRYNITRESTPGFEIPTLPPGSNYIVRLTSTDEERVLADSESFQLYPVGTPPSTTSTPNNEPSTSSSPSPSPTSPEPPEDEEDSKPPIGIIVGGSVGGVAIVVLFFVLLWLLLRKRANKSASPDNQKPSNVKPEGAISPFFIPTADGGNAAHTPVSESIPLTPSSHSRGEFSSSANEKARLKAQAAQRDLYAVGSSSGQPVSELAGSISGSSDHLLGSSSSHSKSPTSKAAVARAEQLRRERERIDKEIAELEHQSVNSGAAGSMRSRTLVQSYTQLIDEPPPEYVPRSPPPPPPPLPRQSGSKS